MIGQTKILHYNIFEKLGKGGIGIFYEQQVDKQLAVQNYEKILNLWKNADEDLADLIDAKERLAKLEGTLTG